MKKKRRKAAEEQPPVVDDESASEAKSFGPWLRRQREGRDIELRDIAQASKISVRYLDALENNRFEALPAELFTKGFLRQYSSFVGLDAEEVVNYYLAAKNAADEEKDEEIPEELRLDRRRSSSALPIILIVLLVAGAIAAAVWWYTSQRQGTETSAPDAAEISQGRETSPSSAQGSAPPPGAEAGPSAPVDAAVAGDAEPSDTADTTVAAASDAAAAPENTETDQAPQSTAIAPGADGQIELVLDFNGDCWVEASIDGRTRVAEMRVQGESLRLAGGELLEIMVGNIDAVEMELNGQPWQPPGRSQPVRRLRIDRQSARAVSAPASSTDSASDPASSDSTRGTP